MSLREQVHWDSLCSARFCSQSLVDLSLWCHRLQLASMSVATLDLATCQDAVCAAAGALEDLKPLNRQTVADHVAFCAELDGLLEACMPVIVHAQMRAQHCEDCQCCPVMGQLSSWLVCVTNMLYAPGASCVPIGQSESCQAAMRMVTVVWIMWCIPDQIHNIVMQSRTPLQIQRVQHHSGCTRAAAHVLRSADTSPIAALPCLRTFAARSICKHLGLANVAAWTNPIWAQVPSH